MEILSGFMPLFTAGIFLISFLALLLAGFNAMLSPLKENQARMETEIKEIKSTLYKLLSKS